MPIKKNAKLRTEGFTKFRNLFTDIWKNTLANSCFRKKNYCSNYASLLPRFLDIKSDQDMALDYNTHCPHSVQEFVEQSFESFLQSICWTGDLLVTLWPYDLIAFSVCSTLTKAVCYATAHHIKHLCTYKSFTVMLLHNQTQHILCLTAQFKFKT